MTVTPLRPRRVASPETWIAAQTAYLAGDTAETVCDRYGLSIHTFNKHARIEGWRRKDQPEPEPLDDTLDLDGPPADREQLLDLAWRHLSRAIAQARSTEAARWLRIHETLLKAARAEAREAAAQETRTVLAIGREARAIRDQARAVDAVARAGWQEGQSKLDVVLDATASRLPNRAERRRQARMGGP